ncbi:L-threonylcarbamoyladenylate synthase [Calothrix sp. UHCC 0171]|uniref:L-threonylcarbamoyladenylate synthase n=1 Tax=Calothrix sp. UHCC 0171 TaxID=3110245 RepID=UPI002B1FF0FE|nr:L-threonylcarbamoyladenylate synthase [Calothrix sp. UHCC 0171]MEA5572374.1 L-threonylcarbamoyladenylate synthase [Calothrix sp. UHCC 0171]
MPQVSINALITGALQGKLVSFPTDTVPALAVSPEKADLIYTAKQRSQDKPLILMAASADELWNYVTGTEVELEIWQRVAAKYFPGAVTLVLPTASPVAKTMNPQNPTTLGIRVPANAITQQILSQTGALATTSANLSGQPALLTMPEIAMQFADVLVLDVNSGETGINSTGVPSTVVKWTQESWQILRQGAVKFDF